MVLWQEQIKSEHFQVLIVFSLEDLPLTCLQSKLYFFTICPVTAVGKTVFFASKWNPGIFFCPTVSLIDHSHIALFVYIFVGEPVLVPKVLTFQFFSMKIEAFIMYF